MWERKTGVQGLGSCTNAVCSALRLCLSSRLLLPLGHPQTPTGLPADPVRGFFSTRTCLCHAGTWPLASCAPAGCVNQRWVQVEWLMRGASAEPVWMTQAQQGQCPAGCPSLRVSPALQGLREDRLGFDCSAGGCQLGCQCNRTPWEQTEGLESVTRTV